MKPRAFRAPRVTKMAPRDRRDKRAPVPYFTPLGLVLRLQGGRWPDELAGRSWQGVRSTLAVLAGYATDGGRWTGTAWQLALGVQLSEKWVRRCLHVLEALGLITWTRYGVGDGKAQPSDFRINKAGLAELERLGRTAKDAAERAHQAETRARLRKIMCGFAKSQRPAFAQVKPAELNGSLPSLKGGGPPKAGPIRPRTDPMTLEQSIHLTVAAIKNEAPAAPSLDDKRASGPSPVLVPVADVIGHDEPPPGVSWRDVALAQAAALRRPPSPWGKSRRGPA